MAPAAASDAPPMGYRASASDIRRTRPLTLAIALAALFTTGGAAAAKPARSKAKSKAAAAKAKPKGASMSDSGWTQKQDEKGKVVQELKIEAPSLNEEDQYGYVMPERYKCDSCKAVMFHLDHELRKRQPANRRMKQWEYTDAFDDICRDSFKGYGVKLVNGENVLSGPGLKQEEINPGMGAIQMGGDTWTKRLKEICRKIVNEMVGEDDTYEHFYRGYKAELDAPNATAAAEIARGLDSPLCYHADVRQCSVGPKKAPGGSTDAEVADTAEAEKAKAAKAKAKKDKADRAKTKKAKEEKPTPAAASAAAATAAGSRGSDEQMDVQTFLRSLAVKHGLKTDDYVGKRTSREWEKLVTAMAGRIFGQMSESEAGGSCNAGR